MQGLERRDELRVFTDLTAFSKAVEDRGHTLDFLSVTKLNTNFLQSSEKYLILNVKAYGQEDPNNLLFLTDEAAFLYATQPPSPAAFDAFARVYGKPYGRSTVATFLTLNKVLTTYKEKLETLLTGMKELEETFAAKHYRNLALEFERLYDRLEYFHDILMRLEERSVKQVETRYISFDYSVLLAESTSLLDRCRHRFNMLKDIARDNELQATTLLNRRIERLNDVVKKLTALTVILMIPNVVAGHFGMNFAFMPELRLPWAYPTVIIAQIVITVAATFMFRKIRWL